MTNKTSNSNMFRLVAIGVLTVFFLIGNALGQGSSSEPADTKNNGDKTERSNTRINPTTLGLELSIPLGNAPGRGGNSLPITFNYSSKVWRMDSYREASSYYGYPIYGEDSKSGWTSSLQPPSLEDTSIVKVIGQSQSGINPRYIIPKFTLHLPDGSTTELVASINAIYVPANTPSPTFTTYFSIDGSNLRLESPTTGIKTLYLPNGSRYEFDSPVRYIDRNGNKMTWQYNSSTSNTEWIDTMGRTIPGIKTPVNPSNPNNLTVGDVDYFVPSLPNQPMKYTFKWRLLADSFGDSSYTIKQFGQLFSNIWSQIELSQHNPVVLQEITLPNGQSYQFRYNEFGEIEQITYPSGGQERFQHQTLQPFSYTVGLGSFQGDGNRGVVDHVIRPDAASSNNEMHWQYRVPTDAPYRVETIAPDASKSVKYLYIAVLPSQPTTQTPRLPTQMAGKSYEERMYSTAGTLISRVLTKWANVNTYASTYNGSPNPYLDSYPKVERTTSILVENGKALAQSATFAHDSYLNVIRQTAFDFVVTDASTVETATIDDLLLGNALKTSETSYVTDSNYTSRQMVSLPQTLTVRNGDQNGAIIAKTENLYDEPGYSILPGGTLTGSAAATWVDPNTLARGNATTAQTWFAEENRWIKTNAQYDTFGNLRKAWDASGDQNKFVETQYSSTYNYAYPTKVITPAPNAGSTSDYGTTETSTAETSYDPTTGLPLSVTNDAGQITKTEYDAYLRPKRVYADNYTAPETQTIYGTPGANGQLSADQRFVKVRKQIDQTNWDEATTWMDGLGRTIKTQVKDSGGDVFVETQYDAMGRAVMTTNPYRGNEPKLWNLTEFDAAGRVKQTRAPVANQNPNAPTGDVLGTTSFDVSTIANYVGTVVVSTDAAGRKSRSITNALGQLTRIDEPTATGGAADTDLGAIGSPVQATAYTYDAYGKMVKVQQGGQSRYFKYDSLGRLIRVRQPEQQVNTGLNLADAYNTTGQWTAGFSYDDLGNVLTATDARGVVITNTYDRANRVKTRTYSGEASGQQTPQTIYTYDGVYYRQDNYRLTATGRAKGSLTQVRNGISTAQTTKYDAFGRAIEYEQITDGATYNSKYAYNFAGALETETYPNGRLVKNEFNSDGNLLRISGKANVLATEKTYANGFSYTSSGAIAKLHLGNGLWEAAKFNSRLQITELGLGIGTENLDKWKVNYDYGEIDASGNLIASKNTGNIAKQTISFAGLTAPLVQTYKYDSLNRLTDATEKSGATTTWQQTFGYDRYGNRTGFYQKIGAAELVLDNKTHPTIDATTNRFTSGQGYTYDFNGNITTDPTDGNRSFTFNGENKQTEVRDANGTPVGKYFYDGDGKRVKKQLYDTTGQVKETTVFVYSSGKLIAEYSTAPPPTNPTTNYVATDILQSVRAISDANGQITSRRDFMPFGEELYPDTTYRKVSDKYSLTGDKVRQRFTGYQKDEETNLDFAEARYYNNQHGRFTAVDPLLASGKSANPQTFNRYVYVGNNPVGRIDPLGTDWYFLNGEYRFSTDNKTFDRTLSHPIDPGTVDGWTQVTSADNPQYRYYAEGSTPGTSVEILLDNNSPGLFQNHWDYTGNEIISDQVKNDAYIKEIKLRAEMMQAVVDFRAQDQALRPLTDVRTGSFPQSPGNLNLVVDRMIPAEDGQPLVGKTGRFLSARERDFATNTGKSVSPIPGAIPIPPKKATDQLFCFGCNRPGVKIVMDRTDPNHLYMQPEAKSIKDMSFEEYTDFIIETRPFWKPVVNPNQLK